MNAKARYNLGTVWEMMVTMRSALLGRFDLSASGVRSSFRAMLVAAPSLAIGWVGTTCDVLGEGVQNGRFLSLLVGVALTDLAAWIAPLIVFAPILRVLGVGARYPAFVIASNWSGVIFAFIALPIGISRIMVPESQQLDATLILAVLAVSLVLYWRLLRAVLDLGAGQTTALTMVNLLVGMISGYGMAVLLGLPLD